MIANKGNYSPSAYDYYWASPVNPNISVVNQVILPGIQEASNDYGLIVEELPWGALPAKTDRVPYVLAGPHDIVNETWAQEGIHNPLDGEATEYLSKLAVIRNVRLNLVTAYRTRGDRYSVLMLGMLSRGAHGWGIDVPLLGRKIGANFIYTDTLLNGTILTNSAEDIADNIRCETFRIGYNDEREMTPRAIKALETAQNEAASTINVVAKTIHRGRLWHQAPTDGAIFVKTSKGWLASHTQTDKSAITPDEFSLIRSVNPDSNTIVSTGYAPPSSDSPEFLAAFEKMGEDIQLAVHFHSNGITRLSQDTYIQTHRTPKIIRYGRFRSTDAVVDALQRADDSWAILKEHGVLWTGWSARKFEAFVKSAPIADAHLTK